MSIPMMKRAAALLALAALASCGGGGGGGGGGGVSEARVAGVAAAQVLEGDSGTATLRFAVTFDKPVIAGVHIVYSTASTGKGGNASTGSATGGVACGAGVDYVSFAGRDLPVVAGATSTELQVTVCGDTVFEPNETLRVTWSTSDGGAGSAIGTIVNDEAGGLNGTGVAGSFGRDSSTLTNGDADGRLGFSFAKAPSAADFQCTRDNVTGLLWEGKAGAASGLHDGTSTYAYADLAAFVAAVNAQALCGFSDWRLPTPDELASLVDAGTTTTPTVDTAFFPNQQAARYWTSSSYRDGVGQDAWFVDFATGTVAVDNKARTFAARLVTRGGTTAPAPLPASCTDTARFTDNADSTISDNRTGLMWKRCAEGFAGASCTGTGAALDWAAATARPATVNADAANTGLGYSDWRLPTRSELSSIAEREQCFNPASNTAAFPGAEPLGFWTSTAYALNASLAWAVDFFDGQIGPATKAGLGSSSKRVRLVRAGQ
jgi:hypothetical protein